ncbi:MAG: tRNA lysidine(34) synthetase TilS, partial [Bacteroidales bacterium]|nr:tRNA lysidine(34) synthetase TilS [Bacteroidales bacterium]
MLIAFIKYCQKEKLFKQDEKILLAISGGVDSVVMCELFYLAGYKFGIAHCNFKLRGNDSDLDEKFVKELSKKYKVPFFCKKFDTEKYAKKNKVSVQMAARTLRFEWFEHLQILENYDYIAAAHHLDDQIETFFINMLRGTGIAGLHGILPKQKHLIHPMLFTYKKDIE